MKNIRTIAGLTAVLATTALGVSVAQPASAGAGVCNYTGIGCTSSASYSGYTSGTSNDTYTWGSADPDTDNNSYGNGLSVQDNTNSARHRDSNYSRFCGYQGEGYTGGYSFSVAYSHPGFYPFSQNRDDQSIRMSNGAC